MSSRRIEGEARRAASHEIDQPNVGVVLHRALDGHPATIRREFGKLGGAFIRLTDGAHTLSVPRKPRQLIAFRSARPVGDPPLCRD